MKIAVIGAGNVGATLAQRIAESDIADVVLVDIREGIPQGKALDMSDAAPIVGHERRIVGTGDYAHIENSDFVVITAGFPRMPGMSREDLIQKNASVMRSVASEIREHAPEAFVIVVTNPLDLMTYFVMKEGNFKKEKVIGMAGTLDNARFRNIIAEGLGVKRADVKTYVLGSHGDTMVPVISLSTVKGKPLREAAGPDQIAAFVERTRKRGAEVLSCLKTGSAYYSPSAGVIEIINAVIRDTNEVLCVSTYVEGEYGLEGLFLGLPARVGKNGVNGIVTLPLDAEESQALRVSADKTKELVSAIPDLV